MTTQKLTIYGADHTPNKLYFLTNKVPGSGIAAPYFTLLKSVFTIAFYLEQQSECAFYGQLKH
jgi:hypothetical protein